MKKFLSVLLALAVAFTFTFGSTMSAFAEEPAYDKDTANALLDYAYTQATATSYSVDYDGKYAKGSSTERVDSNSTVLDDLTVFTIKAEYMQKAIDAAYAGSVLTTGTSTVAGVGVSGTFSSSMTDAQKAANADAFAVKNGLITLAKTDYLSVAEKAAFDEYKTYLASLVDTVDISAYTDTNYKTNNHKDSEGKLAGYLAKDGVRYDTSAEAAAATKAWAKAAISAATYNVSATETPEADVAPKEWKTTYANLYAKIFGDANAIAVKENKDDALVDSLVTSLTYVLGTNDYATKKSEAAADADAALKQAEAKATLNKVVSAFEYSDAYKTAMDPVIAAYKETITYLIENDTTMPTITNPMAVAYDKTNKVYKVNGTDYIAICDAAAKLRADAATAKSNCAITKTPYDEETAKEDLDAQLLKAYKGDGSAAITYFGDTTYTASQKAALKKDYSAAQEAGDVAGYYTWDGKEYYAKEWEVIKAAVDAYNAAIDAATTVVDKEAADKAYAAATTAKLAPVKKTVDGTINSTNLNKLLGYIGNYFTMVKDNYNTAAKNTDAIYISWDGETWKSTVNDADVITWIIAKGARTQAEAEALYADACKVIDAYKSLDAAKNEAAAVKAQIAALPNPVALTDKEAVFAAKDAYDALVGDVQKFVTNYSTLKDDLTAVQKLDKTNIDLMIKALPATTAVTAADRDAIINVKTAVDAYNTAIDDEYYTGSKITNWSESTYMQKLANAEFKAAEDAYKALEVKYSADALTAEDADAVAAAKKALDDFIANWLTTENKTYYTAAIGNAPVTTYEKTLDKMDAVVAAAVAEEAWTTTDVKASLFDSSRKLTIWRTSKTSIRVTSVGSVADIKDHGYTVKYKFYKKAPGSSTYKLVKTTTSNKYTYTNLKKGTNKFQVKVCVYDADGKLVTSKWTYYRAAKIK